MLMAIDIHGNEHSNTDGRFVRKGTSGPDKRYVSERALKQAQNAGKPMFERKDEEERSHGPRAKKPQRKYGRPSDAIPLGEIGDEFYGRLLFAIPLEKREEVKEGLVSIIESAGGEVL